MENRPNTLTLSQLQQRIKRTLAEGLPLPVWVSAEISEMKVNYSGHCYLELVEKSESDRNLARTAIPTAKAPAVIWRSHYAAIDSYFRSATGNALAVGMKVMVRVSVSYHELYGLSLQITDIDPAYTLGDMERRRQQTIDRLQADGVFDMNRELEFPPVVQRVAVVSSRNAAGFQDFMNELARSGYRFDTELFDAFMQGDGAEESIIAALCAVAERSDSFDAVALIRGGGSQSDLSCFNSYRLCSYVAQFPLPVLTGIGHDKDRSVADLVAARMLKTPTAVAGWLVERAGEFDARLEEAGLRVAQAARTLLEERKRRLEQVSFRIREQSAGVTRKLEMRLCLLSAELRRQGDALLSEERMRLRHLTQRLPQLCTGFFARQHEKLAMQQGLVESRKPDNILALGFAIVRRGGSALHDAADAAPGEVLDITLGKGEIKAKVTGYGKKQ